jgi:ArsR family transcriptional regulator, arsenate/arsenite/antimonite-responsive transcriptional repressor
MDEVFKALGDPTRLRILQTLAENGEVCVCVFMAQLEMGQSAISHHMAALKRARLVRARRQGQWIHYSLNVEAIEEGPLAFLVGLVDAVQARAEKTAERACCQ